MNKPCLVMTFDILGLSPATTRTPPQNCNSCSHPTYAYISDDHKPIIPGNLTLWGMKYFKAVSWVFPLSNKDELTAFLGPKWRCINYNHRNLGLSKDNLIWCLALGLLPGEKDGQGTARKKGRRRRRKINGRCAQRMNECVLQIRLCAFGEQNKEC